MNANARVAVLISGGGSNMLSLVAAMQAQDYPAVPVLVLSNSPDAGGLARAQAEGISTIAVDHRNFPDRVAFEAALQIELEKAEVDFICLAGFMRILTSDFVGKWQGHMLNIHPSILPLFPGLNTHARALEAGMSVHGATVHEVTAELDAGGILGQAVVPVKADDTPSSLAARVLPQEHKLYPLVLRRYLEGDTRPVALFSED